MRIFTPSSELPFAGHPTLGTAFVLFHYVLYLLMVHPKDASDIGHELNEFERRQLVEWVRRSYPGFDAQLRRYLFTTTPILEIEEQSTEADAPAPGALGLGALDGKESL